MSFFAACLAFMLILYDMKGVGPRACIIYFYFSMGLDVALAEVPAHPTRWASTPIVSFLVMSVGLLATILAMLVSWVYYLFPWASPTHVLYFLLLVVPMGLLVAILAMLTH